MREQKNILIYGFFGFLIILGILSSFSNNLAINNAINSITIPLFLLSVSTVFSKGNKMMRDIILPEVEKCAPNSNQDYVLKLSDDELSVYRKEIERYKKAINIFKRTDVFTRIINAFATISLILCLLAIAGVLDISININATCINAFSFALIHFEFYMLDDLVKKVSTRKLERIKEPIEDGETQ